MINEILILLVAFLIGVAGKQYGIRLGWVVVLTIVVWFIMRAALLVLAP